MIIERPLLLQKLIRYRDKDLIKVITGVRRCGKSVLLFDIYHRYLLDNGVGEDHIIRVNLEDDVEGRLRDSGALYRYITGAMRDGERHYVMIDEIQYIDGFEDLVNSLKNNRCDVYITGSNSKMLSGDISTALRGRSIEIRVHPLSFSEYYAYAGGNARACFFDYLKYGGFPYVATESDEQGKTEYLKMLESTVAVRDIVDRYRLRNPNVFEAVYDFLCSNIGSLVSAKKISDTLRSNGYKSASPDTVGNYLTYLCESFLFYKAVRYDIRGKAYLQTLNKYYMSDMGLRNAHMNYRQIEVTHALENIVFLELLRRGYTVDIGKNNDREIDFVAQSSRDTWYIQVAWSLVEPNVRARELGAFRRLDDGYKKIVVTMDDDPFTVLENGYRKINALEFLLNERALEEA